MTDMNLREHQLKALEALKVLDGVCSQNNITYCLIAGSTLGAIRHQGFIPWDDDIDVVMTLDNFSAFLALAPNVINAPYTWKHTSVEESYPSLTGGIYYGDKEPLITVFPLVKLSNNKIQRKKQWLVRKVMSPVWQRKVGYRLPREKMSAKQAISIIGSSLLSFVFTKKKVLKILRNNEEKFQDQDTELFCNIYSKYSQEKESIKAVWIKNLIRVKFEDGMFPIMKEYDAYLKHLYGDYMTPPPEKERVPVHL